MTSTGRPKLAKLGLGGAAISSHAPTLQSAITTELRRAIIRGDLEPGRPLRQTDVSELLGVSTTPVREGLRELCSEGLVDGDPRRGMTVHVMTRAELEEIYLMMLPLEEHAMRAASGRISERSREAAELLIESMDIVDSVADFALLNVEFHTILCEASGMKLLSSTLRRLRNLSALYVAAAVEDSIGTLVTRASEEHRALLQALVDDDEERAVELALTHISRTRDERMRAMSASDADASA